MGCKSYESDKYGRITVYPSLYTQKRKSTGMILKLVMKLFDIVSGKESKAPRS